MKRRTALGATALALTAAGVGMLPQTAIGETMDEQAKATLDTAFAFMDAMGKGDMDGLTALMADDMVWHNEGDKSLPWIGNWEGKEAILGFLGVYSENVQTLAWNTEDSFASGDTAAFFGTMNAKLTKTGKETGLFTFALRVKVTDGKVTLWNWFEDSYAFSQAYQG
jgi:ketosteroid isomerase-like protein